MKNQYIKLIQYKMGILFSSYKPYTIHLLSGRLLKVYLPYESSCQLVGAFGRLVCWSVCHDIGTGCFIHFHAPIGALIYRFNSPYLE